MVAFGGVATAVPRRMPASLRVGGAGIPEHGAGRELRRTYEGGLGRQLGRALAAQVARRHVGRRLDGHSARHEAENRQLIIMEYLSERTISLLHAAVVNWIVGVLLLLLLLLGVQVVCSTHQQLRRARRVQSRRYDGRVMVGHVSGRGSVCPGR